MGASGGEQAVDLPNAKHLWNRAAAPWPFNDCRWIVGAVPLGIEKAVKLPDRREPPCQGGGGKTALSERSGGGAHIACRGIRDCDSCGHLAAAEVGSKIGEIARVGGKRVSPGAALGGQHVQEQRDPAGIRSFCGASHGGAAAQRFKNLSGGIETVISRGFGLNQLASMNMPP